MEDFYKKIDLPSNCQIDIDIDKNKFINAGRIDSDDIKILNNYVEKIKLKYSLKSNILNIREIKNNYQDYNEIQVLEVTLNNHLAVYDISRIIGRNIPYPLIIIFINGDRFKISTYHIRENKLNYNKNVVEDIVVSGWFKTNDYNGRINEIIDKIKFQNLNISNMLTMFNSYYTVIKEYKAKYYSINDVLDAFSMIKGITHSKEKLLRKCKWTIVDESIYNKIDLYKTDKMDKYNNSVANAKILLCRDDLFQFIKDNSNIKFKRFKTFEDTIVELKRKKDIKDAVKKKHNKWDCYYYDGNLCINSYCSYYGKNCTRAFECSSFKKEKRRNEVPQFNIDNTLHQVSDTLKKLNFNNTNTNIVEYGDTVEVIDINNNKKKKFIIIEISGKMPTIPQKCLNKSKNQTFEANNTIFKIENIIKNVSNKDENNNIIENDKYENEIENKKENKKENINIVEYGDIVEAINLKNNNIEYFEINEVKEYTPIINILCLGKGIDYKFRKGENRYKIIRIKKGVNYDKLA